MTQEALKLARQLLWRYRHEIPIGHQPYMICHQVDEAFERIDEALAQPEQEPVATVESVATVVSESGNQEVTMSWWHEPALPVGTKLYTKEQL